MLLYERSGDRFSDKVVMGVDDVLNLFDLVCNWLSKGVKKGECTC